MDSCVFIAYCRTELYCFAVTDIRDFMDRIRRFACTEFSRDQCVSAAPKRTECAPEPPVGPVLGRCRPGKSSILGDVMMGGTNPAV